MEDCCRASILTLHSDDNTYLDGEKDIVFRRKSDFQKRMTIDEEGNIGIGIDDPDVTLHIKDIAKLEPQKSAPACNQVIYVGRIYFNLKDDTLKVCTSGGWADLH